MDGEILQQIEQKTKKTTSSEKQTPQKRESQPTTDDPPPHYQPDEHQRQDRRTRTAQPRDAIQHTATQQNTMDNPRPLNGTGNKTTRTQDPGRIPLHDC